MRRFILKCCGNDVNDVLHVSGQTPPKDIKDDTDIIPADLGRNASATSDEEIMDKDEDVGSMWETEL